MKPDFWAGYERAFVRYCWSSKTDSEALDRLMEYVTLHLSLFLSRYKNIGQDNYFDCAANASLKILASLTKEGADTSRFCDDKGNPDFCSKWRPWVSTILSNCVVDWLRQIPKKPPEPPEPPEEPPEPEPDLLQSIRECADEQWLGKKKPDHLKELLFAQMVVLDGETPESAWVIAFQDVNREPKSAAKGTARILKNVVILRHLAFSAMHTKILELLSCILGVPIKDERELARLHHSIFHEEHEQPPNDRWSWDEMAILFLYYYRQALIRSIASRKSTGYSAEQIECVIVRSREFFPFNVLMTSLLARLCELKVSAAYLSKKAVWARLVFEYGEVYGYDLQTVKHMFTKPAASGSCTLVHNTFHSWIDNKRLVKQLKLPMKERGYDIWIELGQKEEGADDGT